MTPKMKPFLIVFSLATPLAGHAQNAAIDLEEIEQTTVSAERLQNASFSTGLNPVGVVDRLILDADRKSLEFILLESQSVVSRLTGVDDGFVLFNQVDFQSQFFDETEVVLEEQTSPSVPEELELTRSEAEMRVVSRILDEGIQFSDGVERELTDILFDRSTGEIAYYVISADDDSLFETNQQLIPAAQVEINDEGQAVASIASRQVLETAGL